MEKEIIACLLNEVKPATGCTEPVAIALAVAHAVRAVDQIHQISSITLFVSTNILKNALNVGVPRTKRVGLEISASLGAFADYQNGLNLLSCMDDVSVTNAHRFQQSVPIYIKRYQGEERIYIEAIIEENHNRHSAIISGKHDHLVSYSLNDEIFFENDTEASICQHSYTSIFSQPIEKILSTIDQMPINEIRFMIDGYHMNKAMAQFGLEKAPGLALGFSLMKKSSESLRETDLMMLAMQMTAAASDARMSGVDLPVMTSNGSGNNGLTAVLPIVAADMIYHFEEPALIKALAMSHIINGYIKYEIGRLSPICACGVASATGAAVGIGYLLGIDTKKLPHIIDTMIANLSGMACDGAKLGCALKLSTATAAAIQSVYLLMNNSFADCKNGIVGNTPEESIRNLGILANRGMSLADAVMTDIMLSKSVPH